jgi:CDP-diacylglycerol pyrophosphatase
MHRYTTSRIASTLLSLAAAMAALSALGRGSLHTPGDKSADLPPNAGADSYRQIVQNQCVLNWTQNHNPSPCVKVSVADSNPDTYGYALLADPGGGAHYLLIPTQTMTGTESAELLDPNLPNYFAEAWHGRDLLSKFVGHPVPITDVGLAVGTAATSKQHQFHIHIECLKPEVVASLKAVANTLTDRWTSVTVAGFPFQGMRLGSEALEVSNPFELVANLSPDARHHMGNYTLVLTGAQFSSGPGFVVLTGNGPSGDLLMDSECSVAGGG